MKRLFIQLILCFALLSIFCISASAAGPNAGLPYLIEDGARYYESSYAFGSGRNGTVTPANPYTTEPCYAGINGYSYLDESGYILDAKYDESTSNIPIPQAPEGATKLFLHFHTTDYRNGWVDSDFVVEAHANTPPTTTTTLLPTSAPLEQEPEEIIEDIEVILQEDKKTSIVIDYSGSMSDNQREVIDLLATLDLDSNVNIIVFASYHEVITQEQLKTGDFYVGSSTYLFPALDEATALGTEQLILISDLQNQDLSGIRTNLALQTVIIYDPDGLPIAHNLQKQFDSQWPNATISRIKIE